MTDDGHTGDGHAGAGERPDEPEGEGDAHDAPDREEFRHDPVAHTDVWAGMTVGELVEQYGASGFGAGALHEAADVYADLLADDEATVFVGLAGAMVPAGMRTIVSDLIRDGHVDVLVTTGATLTHDAIEAVGGKHHHGRAGPHDQHRGGGSEAETEGEAEPVSTLREHDERLREEGVDRIYDVYLPQEHFALLEDHLRSEVFPELDRTVSIRELVAELGRANAAVNEREDVPEAPGIAAAAYEQDVPVYCPAIQDSVLGLQAWMYSQTSDFGLDALADMSHLNHLAASAERAGALVVGGGVPKNYVLQSMLVAPDAYDYAVQLTMDPEATGGLSGATLDEARSWGKLDPEARNATVYGDATITLPILVAAARERLEG